MLGLRLKSHIKIIENHAKFLTKMMPEFLPNLLKIIKKSLQNVVPKGSWAVGGPFREARRPRDWFLTDFGAHFGTHLGGKINKNQKNNLEWFKELIKTLNTLLDGFQHWFLIDFGAILKLFQMLLVCFWGVVNTCTWTQFFFHICLTDFRTSSLQ